MENASKALLIAGGVLIAILVASMGALFATIMANQEATIYKQMEETERTEFNQKFTQFCEYDKEGNKISNNINIQDIITLIYLAKDSNKKYDLTNYISEQTDYDHTTDTSLYVNVNISNQTLQKSFAVGMGLIENEGKFDDKKKEILNTMKNAEQFTNKDLTKILNCEIKNNNLCTCEIETNKNTGYVNYIEIK